MSDEVPAEKGSAAFLGNMEAAVDAGLEPAHGSGPDEELDDYDRLLASFRRTFDEDVRIAIHEAGHAVCARVLGHAVGGVTVNPDPVRGFEGLCCRTNSSPRMAASSALYASAFCAALREGGENPGTRPRQAYP
ncbi:hypothetical protein ACVIHH_003691 [Bradyrhizobium sp. USDA 4518]